MSENIREDLLDKLRLLAERRHRTIDELLEDWLDTQLSDESDEDDIPSGSMAELIAVALKANIYGTGRVTSENSREILENEYADYLKARLKRDHDESSR